MCQHIAKASQARLVVVKNTIHQYNLAALSLEAPAPQITCDEVVEYAFLADFDLLRATDGELDMKPWTQPAGRHAMDKYFKLLRAKEEIVRLNVEIRRVVTWINNEDEFLRHRESELENAGDHDSAVLVRPYRLE
ncbi:hypothetical protein B0H17DRAFT_1212861 [Mycena rosella]|uniref:Uncharacterized protein n=1 Tax=Mycena rosella TaxID=1033263 RepID=A0AAD7CRB8_MYCRO|nr:hypothetical protein B0H17DRAFT_1212861 [Mycena rosella]